MTCGASADAPAAIESDAAGQMLADVDDADAGVAAAAAANTVIAPVNQGTVSPRNQKQGWPCPCRID